MGGGEIKKPIDLCSFLILTVILLSVIGCGGLTVKPEAPTKTPISHEALPLNVGIIIGEQKLPGGFSDFGPRFLEMLRNADIFKEMYYPVIYTPEAREKLDLSIFAKFTGSFVADQGLFGKAFITGCLLFLPAPAITYDHKYIATGDISFKDRKGNEIKRYTEKEEVTATVKIMSPPTETEREGVKSATDNLLSKLIQKIIDDKPFFKEFIK